MTEGMPGYAPICEIPPLFKALALGRVHRYTMNKQWRPRPPGVHRYTMSKQSGPAPLGYTCTL